LDPVVSHRPTAEEQLSFLTKVQRLFAEGDFTATYKFALLISLTELAVEQAIPATGELEVTTRAIAEKFIELYWKQSFNYVAGFPGTTAGVLSQNKGDQAAVINALRDFRAAAGHGASTLAAARRLTGFKGLISEVATVVSAQPLNYLQNFGGATEEFLYDRSGPGRIRFKAGVAYCLQRFQPLIQQLARTRWVDHIKRNRRNASFIGETADLESFLFSTSRGTLIRLGMGLRKLTGSRCFYCAGPLDDADVDHFVPFATYPRDLGHNFVLAHAKCNNSKSDTLAARIHLERWLERNDQHRSALGEIAEGCGMPHDLEASRSIAQWSYQAAREANGLAWVALKAYERIDGRYLYSFER
jgi:5-methylcytosine-specific restriction endonuclease McrA